MRYPGNIAAVAAFFGTWFCLVAVVRDGLQIQSTGWTMAWGVLALWVSSKVGDWMLGAAPRKAKGGKRGG